RRLQQVGRRLRDDPSRAARRRRRQHHDRGLGHAAVRSQCDRKRAVGRKGGKAGKAHPAFPAPKYTPPVPKLSVTIITKNEAADIGAALASVAFADERIVIDSHSTDDTVAIARQHTDRVIVRDWAGYVDQKNYAASQASHDWILSLDADERVTPALADEIAATLGGSPSYQGYRIPRVTWHLGRWVRTTDWYPDYQLRLYDRRSAQW